LPYDLRRPRILNRSGAQAVEAENGRAVGIVNREKSFRAPAIVALTGITAQEFIQCFFAAIESLSIMFPGDRFFVPYRHDYDRLGSERAAAISLALGAGGFSSRSRTRKLSLPERCK